MNVLITNVGRRGYLVNYLKNTHSFEGKVFVSDCDNTASGLYGNNDGAFILPKPTDDEVVYIRQLCKLCIKHNIDVIIPVIDPEIFILSKYKDVFDQRGIFVSVSSNKVLEICYNKLLMNNFLVNSGFEIPQTYSSLYTFEEGIKENKVSFPVIIKPIYGSGSQSTYKAATINEVKVHFHDEMIIQQYINGQEYGVDIFNNLDGKPIRCIVKKKISMRSGETDKAESVMNEKVKKLMIQVGEKLGHICNLDSDVIVNRDHMYVIDLNPRFGGGYPASHEAGVNLLELITKLASGCKIKPEFDNYNTGVFTIKGLSIVSTKNLIEG